MGQSKSKTFSSLTDVEKKSMDFAQLYFLKRMELVRKKRLKVNIFGGSLGVFVIGVYAYTLLSMKQEDFLDVEELPKEKAKHDEKS